MFEEFEASGKHVLITEHAYAPGLDRSTKSGRFCVQFMVFRRTAQSVKVLKWWQDKCIEWCFDRNEEGRFGDQKYLDQWPALFPDEIHVLQQVHRTLAPWNVDYFLSKHPPVLIPVFYHFQSFRILSASHARLVVGFRLSHAVDRFYERYLANIRTQIRFLAGHGIGLTKMPEPKRRFGMLRKVYMRLSNRVRYARLDS